MSVARRRFGALLSSLALGLVALVTAPVAGAQDVPNAPTGAIEQQFYAPGPWAVTAAPNFACCDSSGQAYDLWAPTDLGAGGMRHPIITWGNGTGALPESYDYFLRHLASWGFVVIASRQLNTGTGREILDAARYLAREARRPGSPFQGKLDIRRIGSIGHSQGATGAVNALRLSNGRLRTAVALAIPTNLICQGLADCVNPAQLTGGSVFYLNGSLDVLISPSRQPAWQGGLNSNEAFYNATPDTVGKLWATLAGANHNDVQGQPDCRGTSAGTCANGVYGYLGYGTAWMADRLMDDPAARGAFVSGTGEIFFQTKNWRNTTSNIAP